MGKRKEDLVFYYRGQIERSLSRWIDGYSAAGESGGVLYPWCGKRECQAMAKAEGKRAVFVRETWKGGGR